MKFRIESWKSNKILRQISQEIKISEIKKYSSIWEEMIKFIKNPENAWVWLVIWIGIIDVVFIGKHICWN